MTKTEWDYSALAAYYDNRADYAPAAIDFIVATMGLAAGDQVADVGAGTGKLARPLAQRGLAVNAVEPNDEMRKFGTANSQGLPVNWRDGTGEQTGLAASSVGAVFFGSSFNVVNQVAALQECRRIVGPNGWFCCMWNHRDLDDPLQARIEAAIRGFIPDYNYGLRREDPSGVLADSGLFEGVSAFSAGFTTSMSKQTVMDAWRSHGTLARQAGESFPAILDAIDALLDGEVVEVPYTTRLWYARFQR
ncbi:MAG TPA: class I SAM-dependent methyltransferase [Patescibacteria group bacterium]|nr:class I SAM-dependent methyltransferase [Patescibacteria group bacterium]